jgi:hypothetical protein
MSTTAFTPVWNWGQNTNQQYVAGSPSQAALNFIAAQNAALVQAEAACNVQIFQNGILSVAASQKANSNIRQNVVQLTSASLQTYATSYSGTLTEFVGLFGGMVDEIATLAARLTYRLANYGY